MMTKDKLRQLTGDERLGQMRESEYLGAEDIDDGTEPVLTIAGLWYGSVTLQRGKENKDVLSFKEERVPGILQVRPLIVNSTNRKTLRIAGDDKPAEVVRSRFMKLNADHIRFVLKCLAENSSPIRNMKQYLLASLYNAPTTMQLSYQNQTNHDLAMRR